MWNNCKKILCIRADNMGDLIMTTPALRALKETLHCNITVLTSTMAQSIARYIPVIDDLIVYDLPWIKTSSTNAGNKLLELVELLRSHQFDAAIIFTVYSQSALPAAMLTMMAGIPVRLAYSRENPYDLLTHWLPDKEPYSFIQHQVQRDLNLVKVTGAGITDDRLQLTVGEPERQSMLLKLQQAGVDVTRGYILFHPGVSEEKRKYPTLHWISLGRLVAGKGLPILLTGTVKESELTNAIAAGIGGNTFDMAGQFTTGEFIALTAGAVAVVSVNTATIHIAAAVQTPVLVLYALSNPQHTPWKVAGQVLPYDVADELQSKNDIISWVRNNRMVQAPQLPQPAAIFRALELILEKGTDSDYIHPGILTLY